MRYLLRALAYALYCGECGAENQPGSTYCVACSKMLNP